MGKGEIAHYEQFLLFLKCFQKACFPKASKGVTVWGWVKQVQVTPGQYSVMFKEQFEVKSSTLVI